MNTFRSRAPGLCRQGRSHVWSVGLLATMPLIVFVGFALAMSQVGYAATFLVNSTADVVDAPGIDGCDTGNEVVINGERKPECTLRAAIMEANRLPDLDTIMLPALPAGAGSAMRTAPYRLTIPASLNIVQSLNIFGAGFANTIIDGGLSASGVFDIVRAGARPTVQISGVTIQNGREFDGNGGAIAIGAGARLVLRNTIITNSRAARAGQRGGGIDNAGDLFIFDSTISENTGGNNGGGGIANSGRLFISASTIDGNASEGFGGGGIFNSGGTVRIEESTVSRNMQHGGSTGGGGIFNDGGRLEIVNSTISGNTQRSVTAHGGGIYNCGQRPDLSCVSPNPGEVFLFNVTITDNLFSEGLSGVGGGIANESGSFVFLANTIVAGNFGGDRRDLDFLGFPAVPADCEGTLESQGFNLLGTVTSDCDFRSTPSDEDQIGPFADPASGRNILRLGPLARNGGLTETHALLTNSPAINKGNPARPGGGFTCQVRDQRVLPRLDRCDIGAFEFGVINVPNSMLTEETRRPPTSDPRPVPGGPPEGTVTFTLTYTNVGNVPLSNLVFEVTELSVAEIGSDFSLGGLLLNADAFRGRRGVGARISAPPNRVVFPGGSITQNFIIGRQTPDDSFNFDVDVLGVPGNP